MAPRGNNSDDIEIGVSEVLKRHVTRHVVHGEPVSQRRLDFEHSRPKILREMAAEATGVFFYVYPGISATAAFITEHAKPEFGSMLTIGFAYCFGIALAVITCAATSGGHFNPAITVSFAVWRGFPWKKVPLYIFAQCFGAFVAGLLLMGQYHEQIAELSHLTHKAGKGDVFMGGPASILTTYPTATQHNLGWMFLIEFFVDSFLGLVIWSVLDPANPFITPSLAPFVIGLGYAVMVWGFAPISISTNLAKDLGCRAVAALFYGKEAWTYRSYYWISLFVNIPATLFATVYYELVLRDSLDRIAMGHGAHEDGEEGLTRHFTRTGMIEPRADNLSDGTRNEEYTYHGKSY